MQITLLSIIGTLCAVGATLIPFSGDGAEEYFAAFVCQMAVIACFIKVGTLL